jgi:Asp-tRNA(Asn)/Glu-tRNA(Gln) amidotransferase A subunit family amidase
MVGERIQLNLSATACATFALLLGTCLVACHKEEQAVVGVAKSAVNAEQKAQAAAQAAATKHDRQRAELALIPLPTKSLYVDVHEPGAWANPFLSVGAESLDLRVTMVDANPSTVGEGTMLRPEAARRQEVELRPSDLADALIALPAGAWRYGRVIAVAESPLANRKDRPEVRRNMEAAIQQLSDLGIVVEEWPSR